AQESANLSSKAIDVNGVKPLVSELSGVEPKMLRTMVDDLNNQLGSPIIVLATVAQCTVCHTSSVIKGLPIRGKDGGRVGLWEWCGGGRWWVEAGGGGGGG
ncbi:DHH family phosphoesterase, partial [Escherichia coli]|uniref:DHH family phosphoesterase n=1 Tax=Escherichia coli TaxID=562 RepID=UPI0035DC91E7